MDIIFGSRYEKQYKKLQKNLKKDVKESIAIFSNNKFDRRLDNHPLKGKYVGYRSINAGFDLRIIFREENGYAVVYMIQVGTHSQLYG